MRLIRKRYRSGKGTGESDNPRARLGGMQVEGRGNKGSTVSNVAVSFKTNTLQSH